MNKVLLLNQHYLPLNIVQTKRALNLLHKDKVEMLEKFPNKTFTHNGDVFEYPSVIKMKYFVNVSKKRILGDYYTKLNVWKRDKGVCQYCGKQVSRKTFTVDHIQPKKLGGITKWDNIVTACFKCNNKKDCKPLHESGLKLLKKPIIPEHAESIEDIILHRFKFLQENPHETWKPYLKFIKK